MRPGLSHCPIFHVLILKCTLLCADDALLISSSSNPPPPSHITHPPHAHCYLITSPSPHFHHHPHLLLLPTSHLFSSSPSHCLSSPSLPHPLHSHSSLPSHLSTLPTLTTLTFSHSPIYLPSSLSPPPHISPSHSPPPSHSTLQTFRRSFLCHHSLSI